MGLIGIGGGDPGGATSIFPAMAVEPESLGQGQGQGGGGVCRVPHFNIFLTIP